MNIIPFRSHNRCMDTHSVCESNTILCMVHSFCSIYTMVWHVLIWSEKIWKGRCPTNRIGPDMTCHEWLVQTGTYASCAFETSRCACNSTILCCYCIGIRWCLYLLLLIKRPSIDLWRHYIYHQDRWEHTMQFQFCFVCIRCYSCYMLRNSHARSRTHFPIYFLTATNKQACSPMRCVAMLTLAGGRSIDHESWLARCDKARRRYASKTMLMVRRNLVVPRSVSFCPLMGVCGIRVEVLVVFEAVQYSIIWFAQWLMYSHKRSQKQLTEAWEPQLMEHLSLPWMSERHNFYYVVLYCTSLPLTWRLPRSITTITTITTPGDPINSIRIQQCNHGIVWMTSNFSWGSEVALCIYCHIIDATIEIRAF